MSKPVSSLLQPMADKLRQWRSLSADDYESILSLPARPIALRSQEYIVREGDRPQNCCVILGGYAFRHKVAGNGGRQIFSIHMRGDLADLQNSLVSVADHNLQALNYVEAALIPVEAIQELAFSRPSVGRAMWYETVVDASIFREWTLNVGRRDSRTRTAHMLCEFALRLEMAGLGQRCDYELPMTQEQLADALGLTSVHTNRMLKSLGEAQLISRTNRSLRINDWAGLQVAGDFDPAYLHIGGDSQVTA